MKHAILIIGALSILPLTALAIGYASFHDVDYDSWYSDSVSAMQRNGWMRGYRDGNFGVGDSVTREELATILNRMSTHLDNRYSYQFKTLRTLICSNKDNFLANANLHSDNLEEYEKTIRNLCNGCGQEGYEVDLQTGEITDAKIYGCPIPM